MFAHSHILAGILEMPLSRDTYRKQRAVVNFLFLKGNHLSKFLKGLEKAFGDSAIGCSTAKKWVFQIKGEEKDLKFE